MKCHSNSVHSHAYHSTGDCSVLIENDPSIAAHDAIDRRDTWEFVRWANAFFLKTLANLPGKDLRIIALVFSYALDDIRRGNFRFRATNETRMCCTKQTIPNEEERSNVTLAFSSGRSLSLVLSRSPVSMISKQQRVSPSPSNLTRDSKRYRRLDKIEKSAHIGAILVQTRRSLTF